MNDQIPLYIPGRSGRMAQQLLALAGADGWWQAQAFGRDEHPAIQAGSVMIDFSVPGALVRHLDLIKDQDTALLVGTTGLLEDQMLALHDAAIKRPVLYAPNTGLGIPVLRKMLEVVAKPLGSFECSISETHHVHKKDAPSGTAVALKESLREGGYDHELVIESKREGEVIGEHQIAFKTEYEEIVITHRALDRRLFARGALDAARWLREQPPGFYTMADFLGL